MEGMHGGFVRIKGLEEIEARLEDCTLQLDLHGESTVGFVACLTWAVAKLAWQQREARAGEVSP